MKTMSAEEMSSMDEQLRHCAAGLPWDHLIKQPDRCTPRIKNVQYHGGTRRKSSCCGIRRHRSLPVDPLGRLLLAKSLEQDSLQQLWFSLSCGVHCETPRLETTVGQNSRNRRNARSNDAYNRNTEELLNWRACKKGLEEKYTGNSPINGQRGISTR